MLEIYKNRNQFWQWDTGQRLIVDDDTCTEVHYENGTTERAIVCAVYEADGGRFADVPNIFLQSAITIRAYAFVSSGENQYTKREKLYPVIPRSMPSDYVYTETEVKTFEALENRVSELTETAAETVRKATEAAETAHTERTKAEKAAVAAGEYAEDAKRSENAAKTSATAAEAAKNSMVYVSMTLDGEGNLVICHPELLGTTDFRLNDEGDLEVSI